MGSANGEGFSAPSVEGTDFELIHPSFALGVATDPVDGVAYLGQAGLFIRDELSEGAGWKVVRVSAVANVAVILGGVKLGELEEIIRVMISVVLQHPSTLVIPFPVLVDHVDLDVDVLCGLRSLSMH